MADQTPSSNQSRENLRAAFILIAGTIAVSAILGGFLFYNYSRFLSYAHHTLTNPSEPAPWASGPALDPEGCVEATLTWAENCVGIKALCDEYTTRVTQECMERGDHQTYCVALGQRTQTTEFGLQECFARGTRRHIDAEACANSYRAIDSYCAFVRDTIAISEGREPIGAPSSTLRPRR